MAVQLTHQHRGDLCPGVLQPFSAGDGAIIRVRVPGGEVAVAKLAELMAIARAGAGFLQLTSRGNLQLRGLPDPLPGEIVDAVLATGLVPSPAHERVRNIVMSPLSGFGVGVDVRPIVAELDRSLCADPVLAGLPGRFLFAVDSGNGDMLGEPFDIAYRACDSLSGEIRLAGRGRGLRVTAEHAAATMITAARAFQEHRATAEPAPWHLRELDHDLPGLTLSDLNPAVIGSRLQPGAVGDHAIVGLPLGRLTPLRLAALTAITDSVILTPWRSLVLPGLAERLPELAEAGFVISPDSGWAKVSACTGGPACSRATADTESIAHQLVSALDAGALALSEPVHLAACDRFCGAGRHQRRILVASDRATDLAALRA